MKARKKRVSNLFWPSFSKAFALSEFTSSRINDDKKESEDDAKMQDETIPVGIMDSIKMNKEYKELLENLEIDRLENVQAVIMIENAINYNDNQMNTNNFIIDSDLLFENTDKNEFDQSQPKQDIEIIFLWRSSKLSVASISHKINAN